jgi:hypothetical protein
MIVARAGLHNRTYELHQRPDLPELPVFSWYRDNRSLTMAYNRTTFATVAEAVDALWDYTGCELEVADWWKPVVDGLDISTAKRPVTVTELELFGGDALLAELEVGGLGLETDAGTAPTRAQRALAHRQLRRHYELVIAEELLEQLALAHDLEYELLDDGDEWLIVTSGEVAMESGPLATGAGPLAAVLELQRDLGAVGIQ